MITAVWFYVAIYCWFVAEADRRCPDLHHSFVFGYNLLHRIRWPVLIFDCQMHTYNVVTHMCATIIIGMKYLVIWNFRFASVWLVVFYDYRTKAGLRRPKYFDYLPIGHIEIFIIDYYKNRHMDSIMVCLSMNSFAPLRGGVWIHMIDADIDVCTSDSLLQHCEYIIRFMCADSHILVDIYINFVVMWTYRVTGAKFWSWFDLVCMQVYAW